MNAIYFVSACSDEGESLDLFVETDSTVSAIDIWERWVEEREQECPGEYQVFKLPQPSTRPGGCALEWEVDVQRVAYCG